MVSNGSAIAQDTTLSTSVNVTGVSEYRFRGLSLSNKKPALQGSVSFQYGNLSGGVWASSLSKRVAGANAEVDLYASYNIPLSKNWSASVGGIAYLYAGGGGLDYGEVNSSLTYNQGPVSATFGAAYVPEQSNTSSADNIYLFSSGSYSLTQNFSLLGSLAFEDGAFGTEKWDWSLGTSWTFKQLSFQVSYIDTNVQGNGSAAVVGSVGVSF
jgi:uncharacterized protein (TIGR02001 family)